MRKYVGKHSTMMRKQRMKVPMGSDGFAVDAEQKVGKMQKPNDMEAARVKLTEMQALYSRMGRSQNRWSKIHAGMTLPYSGIALYFAVSGSYMIALLFLVFAVLSVNGAFIARRARYAAECQQRRVQASIIALRRMMRDE